MVAKNYKQEVNSEEYNLVKSDFNLFIDRVLQERIYYHPVIFALPRNYFKLSANILFNKSKTKFRSTLNVRVDNGRSDYIAMVYGVKSTKGDWLIFEGAGYTMPRMYDISDYSEKQYFEYLDSLSWKYCLRRYTKMENGVIVVDSEKIENSIQRDMIPRGVNISEDITEVEFWEGFYQWNLVNERLSDRRLEDILNNYKKKGNGIRTN